MSDGREAYHTTSAGGEARNKASHVTGVKTTAARSSAPESRVDTFLRQRQEEAAKRRAQIEEQRRQRQLREAAEKEQEERRRKQLLEEDRRLREQAEIHERLRRAKVDQQRQQLLQKDLERRKSHRSSHLVSANVTGHTGGEVEATLAATMQQASTEPKQEKKQHGQTNEHCKANEKNGEGSISVQQLEDLGPGRDETSGQLKEALESKTGHPDRVERQTNSGQSEVAASAEPSAEDTIDSTPKGKGTDERCQQHLDEKETSTKPVGAEKQEQHPRPGQVRHIKEQLGRLQKQGSQDSKRAYQTEAKRTKDQDYESKKQQQKQELLRRQSQKAAQRRHMLEAELERQERESAMRNGKTMQEMSLSSDDSQASGGVSSTKSYVSLAGESQHNRWEQRQREQREHQAKEEKERKDREAKERCDREEKERREREEKERRDREEKERCEREEKECRDREEKERRDREKKERRDREEKERRDREEKERRDREEKECHDREEKERHEREEKERRGREEKERRDREEKERMDREEEERRDREEKERQEREEKERRNREEKERHEREEKERKDREEKEHRDREEKERREREEKERRNREEKERCEREEKERRDREKKERCEREEKEHHDREEEECREREEKEHRDRLEKERHEREEKEHFEREEKERHDREEKESCEREEKERCEREGKERCDREEKERYEREEKEHREREEKERRDRLEKECHDREGKERREREEKERCEREEKERRDREEKEHRDRETKECCEREEKKFQEREERSQYNSKSLEKKKAAESDLLQAREEERQRKMTLARQKQEEEAARIRLAAKQTMEKEKEYRDAMRQQETRTREMISKKAKAAAEKLGAGLKPPDDPLDDFVGEDKDKEKVMERRLSVVAQRSARSKERAEAATKWLDKQIRTLITQIQQHGKANTDGVIQARFGTLFQETENIFEALTGLLMTARKHKVISFDGDMLFQGRDDNVLITLLKTEIPDSSLETYTYRQFRACSISHKRKGKGFKAVSLQSANAKCHICNKTVYQMEFVSANDLPMHKACFKCHDCKCTLTTSNYAALNNKFYCKTHFESNYKKRGSYVFEDDDPQPASPVSAPAVIVSQVPDTIDSGAQHNKAEVKKQHLAQEETKALPPPTGTTCVVDQKEGEIHNLAKETSDQQKRRMPRDQPAVEQSVSRLVNQEEEEYEASIKRQESRTRESISRKARKAAEKLGLDEPDTPEDPLEELASEEKDKEKVMERRLSVVAQRSAKSKERAEAATKWLDKQIRMLIKEIQQHGTVNGEKTQAAFGVLFRETENVFEALSGLLITARKHKVVSFDGDMLFQGRDDNVLITLLKAEIPDSSLETYTYRQFRACSISHKRKGKGFKAASLQSANAKCHMCSKTVYPMEFVSANDLPMHKACFRCTDCSCQLTTSNYAALNNKFYCKTHFESNYKKRGSYVFEDDDQQPASPVSAPAVVVSQVPDTTEEHSGAQQDGVEVNKQPLAREETRAPLPLTETTCVVDQKEGERHNLAKETSDQQKRRMPRDQPVVEQSVSRLVNQEEEEYEASIKRQESRTRESISRKARKAAEKLGLDEPDTPEDPLEELASEDKDKEKVMERRLSVVAQRSAKSKERAEVATKWLDKQIRMLIAQIKLHGSVNGEGQTQATFGVLFHETENIFEALSGLLMTARKQKVVFYEGDILFQGRDEQVGITLLKTEIPDSSLETYTYRQFRACSISHKRKGKGFKATSLQSANAKCHVCEKTVYPMEFVSANDLPMHKNCFRCNDCKCKLTTSNYSALNNKFYCKTHFESNYKKRGSYAFD